MLKFFSDNCNNGCSNDCSLMICYSAEINKMRVIYFSFEEGQFYKCAIKRYISIHQYYQLINRDHHASTLKWPQGPSNVLSSPKLIFPFSSFYSAFFHIEYFRCWMICESFSIFLRSFKVDELCNARSER